MGLCRRYPGRVGWEEGVILNSKYGFNWQIKFLLPDFKITFKNVLQREVPEWTTATIRLNS